MTRYLLWFVRHSSSKRRYALGRLSENLQDAPAALQACRMPVLVAPTSESELRQIGRPIGTRAANWRSGDFGTSPFFGQLRTSESLPVCKWGGRGHNTMAERNRRGVVAHSSLRTSRDFKDRRGGGATDGPRLTGARFGCRLHRLLRNHCDRARVGPDTGLCTDLN